MAKLYFRYGAMGSGKSIDILKVAYNYEERGQRVLMFTSKLDDRDEVGVISTRVGMNREAIIFNEDTNLFKIIEKSNKQREISCILVDESQFLSKKNVDELSDVVDYLKIPVICYGLRADFRTDLFVGSKRLLEVADEIEEIKTICSCGRKATNNVRFFNDEIVKEGPQVFVGDTEYKSLCRKCFKDLLKEKI